MPIISVDGISMSFGTVNVLDDITFSVNAGDKIAFIGNNGAGKSTLFRIIKGDVKSDTGKVIFHGNTIAGYLSQNMEEQDLSGSTLKPSVLVDLEMNKARLENEMSAAGEDGAPRSLLDEYSRVCAEYEARGGYEYDYRMAEALSGLGLTGISDRTDLMTLSGGEKMRVCLARLIVERPDILMLDEPTNHLDTDAVEWLEDFLSSYGGAVFLISHDRYFIDRVANRVIELQNGKIREYKGNYDDYKIQKEEFLKTQAATVASLEKELEHQLDVKQTMLSHRNISGYHEREKKADKVLKMLERERALLPDGRGKMSFVAVPEERSGAEDKILMSVKGVSKKFDDEILFEDIDLEVKANEKIFLCGPNGCGKTTLLRMLTGREDGFDGTVYVSASATMGYMGQFVPFDDEERTCLDELFARSDLSETEARSLLARYGFRGLDVFKKISVLSGGERSRLYLCALLLENPDMLFLDEPTNHLDIESREILEDAIKEYSGAVICVSHDRFFIEKCAHKVLGFAGGTAKIFDKYRYYRKYVKDQSSQVPERTEPVTEKEETLKTTRETEGKIISRNRAAERKEAAKRRERLRSIEKEIEQIENRKKELEATFGTSAGVEEYNEYAAIGQRYDDLFEEYVLLSEEEEN